ncbi:MAG TPA: Thivi_2564 family membrane protein [Terracidiphilus sp.]|nr:Thivi_2564 family membrane protein [Terracidiphilus sp.]
MEYAVSANRNHARSRRILLWAVNRFIPMQSTMKSILNGFVVIVAVFWLLNLFGVFHSFSRFHIGS